MSPSPRVALLFPGQGTLAPGMGRGLAQAVEGLADELDAASERLGLDVADLSRRGTLDQLRRTAVAQRVVVAWGIALWRTVVAPHAVPVAVAGHSVGELAAVVAAGMLPSDDAYDLVGVRADAMNDLGDTGSMTSVDGPTRDELRDALAPHLSLSLALQNAPTTHVVSGPVESLDRFEVAVADRRWRTRRLAVGGAFHAPAMAAATPAWSSALDATRFVPGDCAVYLNVDGRGTTDPERVRAGLAAELERPVEWHRCVTGVLAHRPTDVVEVGCSRGLVGWVRRLGGDAHTWSLSEPREAIELVRHLSLAGAGATA